MKKQCLELKQLEIGFPKISGNSIVLLPPISLKLNEGEFVALIGPNGAGKSTLLRTFTGLLPPVSGEILLFGRDLKSYSAHERAMLLSIVLTDHPDDFFLKVEDVVATGRYPYIDFWARLRKIDLEIIENSLQLCGITHLKGRSLVGLSDGERQKVMIAKALAQDTPLIILDEPAAFLDYPSKIELMQLLHRLTIEQNKTVLFSSHDLDLVIRSADRIWMVAHGKPLVDEIPERMVLDGILNAYFDTDGVSFDPHVGQFNFTIPKGKHVAVSEDNLQTKWLKNALTRKGFVIDSLSNSEIIITFENDRFVVNYQNQTFNYETIETLIYEIQTF